MANAQQNALAFVRWARDKNPELYRRIASKVIIDASLYRPRLLAGLNAADGGTDAAVEGAAVSDPGFMSSIGNIISSLGTYQAQKDCSKYNLELIKAGKATVPCGDIAGGVNVGLSPETRNLLMYGGIAILAVILLTRRGWGR
jgi:hypothetical protein